jgi:WD40 repeat protein
VRLLESSGDDRQPFSNEHLSFQAHSNAIIDLAFSPDDYLLATASGDQTGRVLDMMTQTPVALLHHHTASLKQVRFQPGKTNGAVLATSSRDGSVQIWDLRCKGPVQEIPAAERDSNLSYRQPRPKSGCVVNSIHDAHARTTRQTRQALAGAPGDTPSRGELPGRIGDVSVTALQFLPEGQEHLLLTGCEADAAVKLWDIRSTSRHRTSSPLSSTAPPTSHAFWRPFGISSMALSTDSSRLYALCKDNTVYAYSVPHLILGHAPELETKPGTEPPRRRLGGTTHKGLGPMYGFRHSSFHATSFYVKCAVRPARDGRSEMLAVGSSDSCAVLFPTAERYFRNDLSGAMATLTLESSTIATSNSQVPSRRPATRRFQLQRSNSAANLALMREKDDIPIIRNGTPLVRGHDREVGALSWTNGGKLVTVGDDYLIRCWSEGREEARDLRVGGEGGGRRWGCGWADVGEGRPWNGDADDDDDDGSDDDD